MGRRFVHLTSDRDCALLVANAKAGQSIIVVQAEAANTARIQAGPHLTGLSSDGWIWRNFPIDVSACELSPGTERKPKPKRSRAQSPTNPWTSERRKALGIVAPQFFFTNVAAFSFSSLWASVSDVYSR
jgi:hypothetical protein